MRYTTNKYPAPCVDCNATVAPGAGRMWKAGRWKVAHKDKSLCGAGERVITIRTSGGEFYQNSRGRCIDAPCCGCCTI